MDLRRKLTMTFLRSSDPDVVPLLGLVERSGVDSPGSAIVDVVLMFTLRYYILYDAVYMICVKESLRSTALNQNTHLPLIRPRKCPHSNNRFLLLTNVGKNRMNVFRVTYFEWDA